MENLPDHYDEEELKDNASVSEIFEKRNQKYVPEVLEQLETPLSAEVEINREKLNIDYRVISIEKKENKDADPVVVLPGFGSGWEGITELCFSLACEGRKTITLSLPGYGNSDNPSKEYFDNDNFSNESEVINQLLQKLKEDGTINSEKVHLVGHSMAGLITTEFTKAHPEKISSLILLDSAGINEKENPISLATRFVTSGIYTTAEFKVRSKLSGDTDYEKDLQIGIPKTKSPFSDMNRIKQRLSETKKLSEKNILETLNNIDIPITYMAGGLDTVFPPGDKDDPNSQWSKIVDAVNDQTKIETSVLSRLHHNTTITADEITAANIEHYMNKVEKSRKEN